MTATHSDYVLLIIIQQKQSVDKKEKASLISRTLNSPKVDVSKLRELSHTRYGYVSDELRRRVWPILVGIDTEVKAPARGQFRYGNGMVE